MRVTHITILAVIMGMLLIQTGTFGQEEIPESSSYRVDFVLYYQSIQLALETWEEGEAPDSVQLDAYRTASGFLKGIPWHYERNRDRLSIFEQVDEVAEELEFGGYSQDRDGNYIFDYTLWVGSDIYSEARSGGRVAGHGVSTMENIVEARTCARFSAFEEAVREAIRNEYTSNDYVIPGVLDGRITWYEVMRDEVDIESGDYIFDIDAWVSFE